MNTFPLSPGNQLLSAAYRLSLRAEFLLSGCNAAETCRGHQVIGMVTESEYTIHRRRASGLENKGRSIRAGSNSTAMDCERHVRTGETYVHRTQRTMRTSTRAE